MKKVVLYGCRGMLGRQILEQKQIFNKSGSNTNILDEEEVRKEITDDVGIVINCAAYTDVEKAEEEKDKAYQVNAIGPAVLARRCAEVGAKLVHFSTDYVLNDNAYIDNRPLNFYGKSKKDGELKIQNILDPDKLLLLRTSSLYAPWGNNFVLKILKKAKTEKVIKVINDTNFRPTSVFELGKATEALINIGASGTFSVTDGGSCSWYYFAKQILQFGWNYNCEIVSCGSNEIEQKAKRPKNSVLDINKTIELIGPPDHWRKNLQFVIDVYRETPAYHG